MTWSGKGCVTFDTFCHYLPLLSGFSYINTSKWGAERYQCLFLNWLLCGFTIVTAILDTLSKRIGMGLE